MSAIRKSTTSRVHTLPTGCDSETTSTVETDHGRCIVRARRFSFPAHLGGVGTVTATRYEMSVSTPRSRAEDKGFIVVGDADDLAQAVGLTPEIEDHAAAHIVGGEYVQRVASLRTPRRRRHADDLPPVALPSTPPGPGTGQAVGETTPRPTRPTPESTVRGSAEERLYKQMHRRGRQWQAHTGENWNAVRPERVEAQMGKGVTSSKALLTEPGALSVFVDNLTQDLIDRGFDVEAADRASAARRAAASSAPASRSTTAPRAARRRSEA